MRRFVPPQHGAWAMLAVPYVAGLLAAGYRWPDLPLLGAWLAGYLLSYYVFQAVKSRRPGRYRDQLVLYGGVAAPLVAIVVAARPQVLWYAPVYVALFAINAWYAARRQDRAVVSGLASAVQSCLVVFVVATITGMSPAAALDTPAVYTVFVLCLAYFAGTVFYVKTVIRERGNATFRRLSVGLHVVAFAVVAWMGPNPWAAALFGWLLVRAVLLPGRGMTARRVGLVEVGNSALLLLVCAGTAQTFA